MPAGANSVAVDFRPRAARWRKRGGNTAPEPLFGVFAPAKRRQIRSRLGSSLTKEPDGSKLLARRNHCNKSLHLAGCTRIHRALGLQCRPRDRGELRADLSEHE